MNSRYLKNGRTSLLELASGAIHRLDLTETGEAIERDSLFECRALNDEPGHLADPEPVPAGLVDLLGELGDQCERATIISGVSHHICSDDAGTRTWDESTARLHLSLVNRTTGVRCEIERGGRTFDPGWTGDLRATATAIREAEPGTLHEPAVLLEPAVAATFVAAAATARGRTHGLELVQRPREGERDGRGHLLQEQSLTAANPDLGWFRPSYRVRPFRAPHGLDLEGRPPAGDLPRARVVALYGRPYLESGRLVLPSVIVGARSSALLADVAADLDGGPTFTAAPPVWFPLDAGVWGREIVVSV